MPAVSLGGPPLKDFRLKSSLMLLLGGYCSFVFVAQLVANRNEISGVRFPAFFGRRDFFFGCCCRNTSEVKGCVDRLHVFFLYVNHLKHVQEAGCIPGLSSWPLFWPSVTNGEKLHGSC